MSGEIKTYYVCDPDKNTACPRTHCGIKPVIPNNPGPCTHTTRVEFAKQPIETVKLVIPMSAEEAAQLKSAEE